MREKELRKLNRAELLEMMVAQGEELQACKEKLAAAEAALQNRSIALDNAGSIAEASLVLNGVFEAAQAACQQYSDNIRQLSERQEEVCRQMEEESRRRAAAHQAEVEQRCEMLEAETKARCDEMVAKAKAESQTYWDELSSRMERFYAEHTGLRELLGRLPSQNARE